MKINNILISFGILLLAVLPAMVFADSLGVISKITYSPAEPTVLNDMQFDTIVKNPTNDTHSYLLEIDVVKDGKIVHTDDFTFSLGNGKEISFKSQYTPEDIGQHEIVAKLYDKYQIELYDTKITQTNVISHIGPFDVSVSPLTNRIRPGFLLPVTVLLENMGTTSTDVQVNVSVTCPNATNTETFTTLVTGNNQTEKLVSVRGCSEEGSYDVRASVILFNKTWISSSSQFIVNSTYTSLEIDGPDSINLKRGENYTFSVKITNIGNLKVNNLRFVIQIIPLDWQKTIPEHIDSLSPNETAVFISTISIPDDAEYRDYQVRLTAVSNDVLERKIITLSIKPVASEYNKDYFAYLVPGAGLATAITGILFGVKIIRNRKFETTYVDPDRLQKLKKLIEKLRSKA